MNVRKQLENLGKCPSMYGVTREALLVHAHVLLCCVGLDSSDTFQKLTAVGKPPLRTGSGVSEELLLTRIQTPDDAWAQELSQAALALLPPDSGSGEYEFKRVT
jgi:hypothetical protein